MKLLKKEVYGGFFCSKKAEGINYLKGLCLCLFGKSCPCLISFFQEEGGEPIFLSISECQKHVFN